MTEKRVTAYKKTVSHSEVGSYLDCERKHYYDYGLGITRKYGSSDSLNRGTLGHSVCEVYFKFLMDHPHDVDGAKQAAYAWLGAYMMSHPEDMIIGNEVLGAFQFFIEAGGLGHLEVLAVEKEFLFEITPNYQVVFIVDLIARAPDGTMGVIDNKFVKNLYSDRDTELLTQLPKYMGMLQAMGYDISWVAYNELRWYAVKDSTVATRYAFDVIDLTTARVQRTFREHSIVAERILTRKALALEQGEEGLSVWSDNAVRTANTMVCSWCPFRALCVAELNDDQAHLVLDREYIVKPPRQLKNALLIESGEAL